MNDEDNECGNEPTTHDEGDAWADRAPKEWIRCAKCGDWRWFRDDHRCKCEKGDEE